MIATLTFHRDLATLEAHEIEGLADMLATIACEIKKGEHRGCGVHELEVTREGQR